MSDEDLERFLTCPDLHLDAIPSFICKHCPAKGVECAECHGRHEMDMDDDDPRDVLECSACGGTGISVVPGTEGEPYRRDAS